MKSYWFGIVIFIIAVCLITPLIVGQQTTKIVQGQAILTVSEGKRLIAKAIAQMPEVKEALSGGMVIIAKGTTNTYVAEEIVGRKIEHGAYVYGRTHPQKGGKRLNPGESISEFILVNGKVQKDLSLSDAVKKLKRGDVVLKGANALDYQTKNAGVLAGSSTGGTTGTFLPYVVARKAHLIIPVGLEKQVAGNPVDIARMMKEPTTPINGVPSMFLLPGQIVTEIEALKILAEVEVYQVAAGGIGGAEGAVRLLIRGSRSDVEKALQAVEQIQGEPPFAE
ncbi:MAG: hypothetical protein JRF02_00420 [Deltaproteobacteria bacterium]|jgi:hypothetical protein|nr:hypothetical protein [Deltaproteobacteria bacterium]